MDIRELINLRKEEHSFERVKMTGFMKGQKTKSQHHWHMSPSIRQPTICVLLAKGTLKRNKAHLTVLSLRAQGVYPIQSQSQKNWLLTSKNGALLNSCSAVSRTHIWEFSLSSKPYGFIPSKYKILGFYTLNWI